MPKRKYGTRKLASYAVVGVLGGAICTLATFGHATLEWDLKLVLSAKGKLPLFAQRGKAAAASEGYGSAGTDYVLRPPGYDENWYNDKQDQKSSIGNARQLARSGGKGSGDPYSGGFDPTEPSRKSFVTPRYDYSWDTALAKPRDPGYDLGYLGNWGSDAGTWASDAKDRRSSVPQLPEKKVVGVWFSDGPDQPMFFDGPDAPAVLHDRKSSTGSDRKFAFDISRRERGDPNDVGPGWDNFESTGWDSYESGSNPERRTFHPHRGHQYASAQEDPSGEWFGTVEELA